MVELCLSVSPRQGTGSSGLSASVFSQAEKRWGGWLCHWEQAFFPFHRWKSEGALHVTCIITKSIQKYASEVWGPLVCEPLLGLWKRELAWEMPPPFLKRTTDKSLCGAGGLESEFRAAYSLPISFLMKVPKEGIFLCLILWVTLGGRCFYFWCFQKTHETLQVRRWTSLSPWCVWVCTRTLVCACVDACALYAKRERGVAPGSLFIWYAYAESFFLF